MKKGIFILIALHLLLQLQLSGQKNKTAINTILTADSLASGNLKDLLSSFFQLSFNKLTGPSKELNFQSNPYALIARANPSAAIDTNYVKYKILRKFNFGFGLKMDTSYRFNGFSSGIKYALINRRDVTTSQTLFDNLGTDQLNQELVSLQNPLSDTVEARYARGSAERTRYQDLINEFFTDTTKLFSKLDPVFQKIVIEVAEAAKLKQISSLLKTKPDFNIRKKSQEYYSDLKNELQKKLLWTISISDTTYKDQFLFSNIVLQTELLKGVGKSKPGANWELSIPASLNFLDDTLRTGRDLKRAVFIFDPGINLVIRDKSNKQSFLEFKFSGEYRHNFHQLYPGEKRDFINFNGTLRIRVINDIWIPLQFKYDPANGNVFGFISAKLNFNGLAKK